MPASPPSAADRTPMSAELVAGFLGALALAEERGAWDAVEAHLRVLVDEARIEETADEATRVRLAQVRERLAAAKAYEAVHGRGALLVKNHPFNLKLEDFRRHWAELEAFQQLVEARRHAHGRGMLCDRISAIASAA